ncbi:MAG: hypothetical protein LC792_15030 [Actinobacteria bacterium]|nr:hypothetical protein [Actinomycetota bacterium]
MTESETESETHEDEIVLTDVITQALARLPEEVKTYVQHGAWVELARSTHDGHCPDDPTQRTGPAWDWVEHGAVRGSYGDGQCGGCGGLNRGWVRVHEALWARLRAELVYALAALADGADPDDVATGSEHGPGVYLDGANGWIAWDFDPEDPGQPLTVYESDLAGSDSIGVR